MRAYLLPVLLVGLSVAAHGGDADQRFTAIDVDGEESSSTATSSACRTSSPKRTTALFTGYGYAIAQDRLWQLELFRHAAQGRLAELLGATTVPTNLQIGQSTASGRRHGHQDQTLHGHGTAGAARPARCRGGGRSSSAYAEGINRYLTTAVAADPASKLPFEFHSIGNRRAGALDGSRCRSERRLPVALRPGRWPRTAESDSLDEPDQQTWSGGRLGHLQ